MARFIAPPDRNCWRNVARSAAAPRARPKSHAATNFPPKWVIHTVGPVWRDGDHGEDELLASCYRSCFALVVQHGIKTVAFPSISTGAYGFPMERAARIALRETKNFLEQNRSVESVVLVCFGADSLQTHQVAFREICI